MKKYLADFLTLARLILAISLIIIAFTNSPIVSGFLIFVFGELTDAFDGTCASKWPFPKNKVPKYRKYAAKYDMIADASIIIAMLIFFIMRINLVFGLALGLGYGIIAIIIDLIVYGKIMGHPDDFKPGSLSAKNFLLAKKIILARRMVYLTLIATITIWTLYASEWQLIAKNIIMIIAVIMAIFLWFFLAQRRHNISRDAVKIEQKLSRK